MRSELIGSMVMTTQRPSRLSTRMRTPPRCSTRPTQASSGNGSSPADDRVALERLCRYGLRAPFAVDRFSLAPDGRVVYRLRKPWPKPGGARCLVLEPGELLGRLAALVPAPYSPHGPLFEPGRSGARAQARPPP